MTTQIYAADNQAQATFGSDVADGTLTLKTGAYGAKVNALVLDGSGNATVLGNAVIGGNETVTGNLTVGGKIEQTTPASMVRVHTPNGYGSTNTVIRRFLTVGTTQGTDITYADSAANGASFTINTNGVYAVTYIDAFNTASAFGVSLNSTQLTTNFSGITNTTRIASAACPSNDYAECATVVMYFSANDVIRPHTNAATTSGTNYQMFTITRVA